MNSNKLRYEVPVIALAFVGDAVYDSYIRTMLVEREQYKPSLLHKRASFFSNAAAQSKAFLDIQPRLTEEEKVIANRGRNAKSNSIPKNASVIEYKNATALETLIGYLHLKDRNGRIKTIMEDVVTILESEVL